MLKLGTEHHALSTWQICTVHQLDIKLCFDNLTFT